MRFELRGGGPADGLMWMDTDPSPTNVTTGKKFIEKTEKGVGGYPTAFQVRAGGAVTTDEDTELGRRPEVPLTRYVFSTVDQATNTIVYVFTPLAGAPS